METTISTVLQGANEPEPPRLGAAKRGGMGGGGGGARGGGGGGGGGRGTGGVGLPARRSSLDLTSNGSSSRSISKTVSETSSFYSSNNLPE